jgi:integrase
MDTQWTHWTQAKPMTTHDMFDGRLQLYKRPGGRFWQCAARVGGARFRETTKEELLDRAKDVAEEWYLGLRGKLRNGEVVKDERTFRLAAQNYLREMKVLAVGLRSPKYLQVMELRFNRHLLPFFGDKPLSAINRGLVQAYRVKRAEETIERTKMADAPGKPPARSTMTQEIVHIRQVLKWAEGMGWIPFVPDLNPPYKTQGKKGRRAWFSPEEYAQLYTATRRRTQDDKRRGWRHRYEDLHDFVLFMANTGLRPDEAMRLELRDVKIEYDPATKQTILVIDVRGKTGVGYCKSTFRAVHPFERLKQRRQLELELAEAEKKELTAYKWNALLEARRKIEDDLKSGRRAPRHQLSPSTRVFPRYSRSVFNDVLREEGLKFDRDGQVRTAYSLRHTYISTRLMEGANVHQIANNCRTSVKMIEEFYAAHIKDRLDAAAINVQRPASVRKALKAKPIKKPRKQSPDLDASF